MSDDYGPTFPAPTGRHHPDSSWEAADTISPHAATVRGRCCVILSVAGQRGFSAIDTTKVYNGRFRRTEIDNGMAARFQEMRGESKDARQAISPPWVEYVCDLAPLPDSDERLDRKGRLTALNCNGNRSLLQRLTPEGERIAARVRNDLIRRHGVAWLDDMAAEIRRLAGSAPSAPTIDDEALLGLTCEELEALGIELPDDEGDD